MALDVYLTNTAVTVTVDLLDGDGNALSVTSVDYRVIDQDDRVLLARTAVPGFIAGDAQATITIDAGVNTLATGMSREIRTVELIALTDVGTVGLVKSYGIETLDPLKVPENSFQSYAMAELMSMNIPNIDAYKTASEQQRIAALMDAREHLVQLNFSFLNSNSNFAQDQLAYVPEGQYQSAYVARNSIFLFSGDLSMLGLSQFVGLPDKFKRALRQAQIVEANAILGGEPDDAARAAGIVEEEIGESRRKYSPGAALRLPVCKRALSYLSGYVTFAKRIGRA